MNWDNIKLGLHLDKLNSADIPTGISGCLALVAMYFAITAGKWSSRISIGLVGFALLVGAVLWNLHNR